MTYWISLEPGWKLQDVQAGLNVIIAFICAGGIFILVRYCWLLAARQVAQEKDVPASSLLSLNTFGETVDIIWLLRNDLLTRRYLNLLLQCICVICLTVAALMSGFIARFSTRNGTVLMVRMTNGSIAERSTGDLQYAGVDTNATLYRLQTADFPYDQLLEYMPNPENRWEYVPSQWNSSWHLDCKYNESVEVPNVRATGNCTGIYAEIPQLLNNWEDWDFTSSSTSTWSFESVGWRNNYTTLRDVLIFTHGTEYGDTDPAINDTIISGRFRTVVLHLEGVPTNSSLPAACYYGKGPVLRATYTSATCRMTRSLTNRTWEDAYWGAFPDATDSGLRTSAYAQHYANNFRKQSSRDLPITPFTGQELVRFYQAYIATKDTSTSPFAVRPISVYVEVAQMSIVTLIICCVAALVILFGLFNYWFFLFRHWSYIGKAPQSKLDWMLKTLHKDGDSPHHGGSMRQRLKRAMASGHHLGESVPLTTVGSKDQSYDRKRPWSVTSSTTAAYHTPELARDDDGFETPILVSNFSGARPGVSWFPQGQRQQQQYQQVGGGGNERHTSFGLGLDHARPSNTEYLTSPPTQNATGFEDRRSPYIWTGTHHVDTTYDSGRW